MQFGFYDASSGGMEARKRIYAEWRERWIAEGMPWNGAEQPPQNWDPRRQLKNLT
jgi:hypothetical protein